MNVLGELASCEETPGLGSMQAVLLKYCSAVVGVRVYVSIKSLFIDTFQANADAIDISP